MMTYNLIVGKNASVVDGICHAVVVGDDCAAIEHNSIVVGSTLFGEPIPETVKTAVKEHGYQINWLLRTLAQKGVIRC